MQDKAERFQEWHTPKPDERCTLTVTLPDWVELNTDDPVRFVSLLAEVQFAALSAIWLELASWQILEAN